MQESPNPLDKLLPAISEAVVQWEEKNTPKKITTTIHKMLDTNRDTIVKKLLGFDSDRWTGKDVWTLDHCNGRAGESAAGDYIRKTAQAAIQEWLSQAKMPALLASEVKSMQSEMRQVYRNRVGDYLHKLVVSKADQDATELFNKITKSNDIDSYIKAMQLISPTQKET
jgi:hypothetical protein